MGTPEERERACRQLLVILESVEPLQRQRHNTSSLGGSVSPPLSTSGSSGSTDSMAELEVKMKSALATPAAAAVALAPVSTAGTGEHVSEVKRSGEESRKEKPEVVEHSKPLSRFASYVYVHLTSSPSLPSLFPSLSHFHNLIIV